MPPYLWSPSRTDGSCGIAGKGGEALRWFVTCGAQQFFSVCRSDGGGADWTRQYNGLFYDFAMYLRTGQGGTEVACNDDGTSMGGTNCSGQSYGTGLGDANNFGSRLNNVATPRGLGLQFNDERLQNASSAAVPNQHYQMIYTIR